MYMYIILMKNRCYKYTLVDLLEYKYIYIYIYVYIYVYICIYIYIWKPRKNI